MEPEIALQAINEYAGLSKPQIGMLAEYAVEAVLEQGNILQVAESLSAMEELVKTIRADGRFMDYVREEAAKHGKVFTSSSGAKIELCEAGTKYDYSKCGDVLLAELENGMEMLKKEIDGRKEWLKKVPAKGVEIVLEDEVVMLYPPVKSSVSSYRVTLSKKI